ncbi:hypothetical protein MYSTI_02432 [Myxococcus stipitatus DSM 14675]|uniref:HEXXH motif domain-containing protein n=1 Tax=Myxococcus stipitatus (strain DSM 14675 / JCM 12634 / Mx s8) TaxID=1278073 RepID=L7U6K0_MYXSD|nr:HEXXH motif-containing putative peptide modification protein [Myxococcus stipitatus]AGC43748.1 hypothetical protein MYSTI_02432 [Myxococcus stipitatus DSM 14675]
MTTPKDLIQQADRALVAHPSFGDTPRILARVITRYRFGLELFAERLPSLARTVTAIEALDDGEARRIFFDPLVRLALEQAFSDLETGRLQSPHPLEECLPAALAALPLGLSESRMPSRWLVGQDTPKWLWGAAQATDPYSLALQAAFDGVFGARPGSSGKLLSPDAEAQRRLNDAIELLTTLLPHSGVGALTHVEAIALLSARLEGGTVLSAAGGDLTPSTIFLAIRDLGNPWDIAGCILHEALHMKLFDATRSTALVAQPEETIQVPWRNIRWSIVRAVFSYHVYVHLALFKAAALSADDVLLRRFGDPSAYLSHAHATSVERKPGAPGYDRSIDRTRFLGQQLSTEWSHLLTPQGRDFVRWLNDSLEPVSRAVYGDAVRESPPPTVDLTAYRKTRGLRARASPRGECLMVFSPEAPRIHWLDLNAWLIFELSDGRTLPEMERAYLEVVGGRVDAAEARRQLRTGLDSLVRSTLVEPTRQQGEAT